MYNEVLFYLAMANIDPLRFITFSNHAPCMGIGNFAAETKELVGISISYLRHLC